MADYVFKGYDNFVLENKIESILSTKLDMNRFMTADFSLSEAPGMIKKIHRYSGTGATEDLARGEGNSQFVDAEYVEENYVVMRNQGQAKWYDDDAMNDPSLIDAKVQYLSEGMVNSWTAKAIAEFAKSNNMVAWEGASLAKADFANAIAKYANRYEDQSGLFFLVDIKMVPSIRAILGDDLKYTEAYIRSGAIGDIYGVPIFTSKALPKDIIFCAHADAVHAFIKKGVSVEQQRDIDKKENFLVAARWAVIALVNEGKCVKLGKSQGTSATITTATKATKVVAGAATTGAEVYAYVNGVLIGHAAAASSAYSITGSDNLVAGDKVKVVAKLDGYLDSISDEFTVAS